MIRKNKISIPAVFSVLLFFAACTPPPPHSMLPDRVKAYHDAYRWGYYSKAALFVDDPQAFLEKAKNPQEKIEITEFEILNLSLSADKHEAIVEIRRSYIISPSVTVKTQILEQKWKYDKTRKDWFLVTPY